MKTVSKAEAGKVAAASTVRALTAAEVDAVSGGATSTMLMVFQPIVLPPNPCRLIMTF